MVARRHGDLAASSGGDWIDVIGPQIFYAPTGKSSGTTLEGADPLSLAAYFAINSPSATAGQATV